MNIADYSYWYTENPIILVNGAAGTGIITILNLMQANGFPQGPTQPSNPDAPNFVKFKLLPGHSLMNNEVAMYPFANQSVAANAIITQPLELSIEMLVPATAEFDVLTKFYTMSALKSKLDEHTAAGGWYDVVTPSYVYTGCLLTSLVDASPESMGAQAQVRWVWSFMQPLLTAESARPAQNQEMSNISKKTVNAGDPPGTKRVKTNTTKASAGYSPNVVPAAKNNPAANTPPPTSSPTSPSTQNLVTGNDISTNGYY
jgi:hypothetical protein